MERRPDAEESRLDGDAPRSPVVGSRATIEKVKHSPQNGSAGPRGPPVTSTARLAMTMHSVATGPAQRSAARRPSGSTDGQLADPGPAEDLLDDDHALRKKPRSSPTWVRIGSHRIPERASS
jgi:hypothetical protein